MHHSPYYFLHDLDVYHDEDKSEISIQEQKEIGIKYLTPSLSKHQNVCRTGLKSRGTVGKCDSKKKLTKGSAIQKSSIMFFELGQSKHSVVDA